MEKMNLIGIGEVNAQPAKDIKEEMIYIFNVETLQLIYGSCYTTIEVKAKSHSEAIIKAVQDDMYKDMNIYSIEFVGTKKVL